MKAVPFAPKKLLPPSLTQGTLVAYEPTALASCVWGRVTVKVEPFPTALSTVMVLLWRLTILATVFHPMPRPGIARWLKSVTR